MKVINTYIIKTSLGTGFKRLYECENDKWFIDCLDGANGSFIGVVPMAQHNAMRLINRKV